jgi:hypothetical protein
MGIIAPPNPNPKVESLVSSGEVKTATMLASAGVGVFGHAAPGAQHAALASPKTLLEVEAWALEVDAVMKSFGFTA